MSKELLLEIGTEEIPSAYLNPAINKIEELSKRLLAENRITYKQVKVFGTPRRLVLLVEDISERQAEIVSKIIGPPKKVSFDGNGLPTQSAVGFAKGQGVRVEDLQIEKTEKGEYICIIKESKGEPTKKILPDILSKLILAISFPKYMRWGEGSIKFVRPIHWILAVHNGMAVKFELDGIKSGNRSFGHRFLSPGRFTVRDFASYEKKTKENYIVFNHIERRAIILKEADKLAKKAGGNLYEDDELLNTVTHLVEYPFPIAGEFEKEYLELPKEILISVMKKHQRYFPIVNSSGGLLPKFIAFSNNKTTNPAVIKAGYEKVLKARFSDARFFYEEDKKKPLHVYTEKLRSIVFQERLGTYYEKVERIANLAFYLADLIDPSSKETAERTAFLCKTDLVTQMVYEFPDLQGIMGREYALLSGEKTEVANAIYEHYLPKFAGDKLPESHAGAIAGIADKIDTISGCFGNGLIPTGSEDPYALRRQTLAIINIVLGKGYQIPISDLIDKSIEILKGKLEGDSKQTKKEVLDFFKLRLKNQLISDGISYDIIDAVISVKFNDILDAVKRIKALSELKSLPIFEPLTTAFKRISNIVKEDTYGMPEYSLFKEDAEKELYNCYNNIKNDVEMLINEKKYLDALKKITVIKNFIDRFFDEVMVMVDEKTMRENRLNLLSKISVMFKNIADFTRIVVTG